MVSWIYHGNQNNTGFTLAATFIPTPRLLGLGVRMFARNMRDRQEMHFCERINKILYPHIEMAAENQHFQVGPQEIFSAWRNLNPSGRDCCIPADQVTGFLCHMGREIEAQLQSARSQ